MSVSLAAMCLPMFTCWLLVDTVYGSVLSRQREEGFWSLLATKELNNELHSEGSCRFKWQFSKNRSKPISVITVENLKYCEGGHLEPEILNVSVCRSCVFIQTALQFIYWLCIVKWADERRGYEKTEV